MHFLDRIKARRRIKRRFRRLLGYSPNFKKPATYCEKIQWLKFNHNTTDKNVISRTDKYAVRQFIQQQGFGQHLVKLFGCWDSPYEIDWQQLPSRFVLKLNNASGPKYCWFVKDKSTLSIPQFEADANKRMFLKFGYRTGEFHYAEIPPKIIAEEYLDDHGKPIKDYKFYCFDGYIAFFSVEEGKAEGLHVRDYYDLNWNRQPVDFYNDVARPKIPFEKPDNFERMIDIARTLSQGYPHVRVDLYNVNGKVYFGELTYTPECGITQWKPLSLDYEYGNLINLDNISN